MKYYILILTLLIFGCKKEETVKNDTIFVSIHSKGTFDGRLYGVKDYTTNVLMFIPQGSSFEYSIETRPMDYYEIVLNPSDSTGIDVMVIGETVRSYTFKKYVRSVRFQ